MMRTVRLIFIVAFILVMLAFAYFTVAGTAFAQDSACDLSGAEHIEVRRYYPRPSRRAQSTDVDVMAAPELWTGTTVGALDAYASGLRYASVAYILDVTRPDGAVVQELLHLIDITSNADRTTLNVIIMPADRREANAWHGCIAFTQPVTGEVEAWLDSLVG